MATCKYIPANLEHIQHSLQLEERTQANKETKVSGTKVFVFKLLLVRVFHVTYE